MKNLTVFCDFFCAIDLVFNIHKDLESFVNTSF